MGMTMHNLVLNRDISIIYAIITEELFMPIIIQEKDFNIVTMSSLPAQLFNCFLHLSLPTYSSVFGVLRHFLFLGTRIVQNCFYYLCFCYNFSNFFVLFALYHSIKAGVGSNYNGGQSCQIRIY